MSTSNMNEVFGWLRRKMVCPLQTLLNAHVSRRSPNYFIGRPAPPRPCPRRFLSLLFSLPIPCEERIRRVMGEGFQWKRLELSLLIVYAIAFYAVIVRRSLQLSRDHSRSLSGLRRGWMFNRLNVSHMLKKKFFLLKIY